MTISIGVIIHRLLIGQLCHSLKHKIYGRPTEQPRAKQMSQFEKQLQQI